MKKADGVPVTLPTTEQIARYEDVADKVRDFDVPQLYDSADPKARVFYAMFDGTGNNVFADPHATNIGMLKAQIEAEAVVNSSVSGQYLQGPGTQAGYKGNIDGITGGTYHERIDEMYEKYAAQCREWIKEDPDVKISVISVGFSRGAEQAAGFTRIVHERGIPGARDLDGPEQAAPVKEGTVSRTVGHIRSKLGLESGVQKQEPAALRAPGSIAQAIVLYDPVGTGVPARNDRRLPPSVITGIQINADDELRKEFPSSPIIRQGTSEDGRFLGVTTAGAHSDVGGGYEANGLSHRAYNIAAAFMNKLTGDRMIKEVHIPTDPNMSVIHDSSEHRWVYTKLVEREILDRIEPSGRLQVEPVDSALQAQYRPAPSVTVKHHENAVKNPVKAAVKPAPQAAPAQDKSDAKNTPESLPARSDPAATARPFADHAREPSQDNQSKPPRDAVAGAVPAPATDGNAEFAKAIKAAGLELKEPPVMDGTLQRVPVAGRAPDNCDGA
ncbi:phospholipase effector Tle1 domain-containing protein [Massilia pseudoviolaceinigra]|uniref:phospholipase effector Tle1 domain-containing protein n=1 Tax=Massilia pseudoviolaceinigra TaxID=3057165 RepID=UPI0027966D4B|nr:DUF2235 domain-containing protein [Massilia sp. CCM 9206]MDQ1925129.1 DUF2235 domain-containing protein [Massilia sp. CCM 9206]